jgi:hypothetical protein
MPFVADNLGLSEATIAQIAALLSNATIIDPIGDSITRMQQVVGDFTERYLLPDERITRLLKPLVLYDIYSQPALAPVPPTIADNYKIAMKELTDIRDGKFHDLQQNPAVDPNLSGPMGGYGSDCKVRFHRGGGGETYPGEWG